MVYMLQRAARVSPDGPAITFAGRTRTWAQVADRCARLGAALAGLGVGRGDRVGILAFNSDRYMEVFFGPAWIGAVFVPVNYRLAVPEMVEVVADSTPRVLLADATHVDQAREIAAACPGVAHLVYADDGPAPEGFLEYEALLAAATPGDPVDGNGDDLLVLFYTGGTTGLPKGVMLTNTNLYANAMGGVAGYRYREHAVFIQCGPMFHAAAGSRVYSNTMTCSHTIMLPHFDVETVFRCIQEHRVTVGLFVPTMINMMLHHPRFHDYDLTTLHQINYGAAPMPEALMRLALEMLPGVVFFQAYGMTEASPIVTTMPPEWHATDGPRAEKLSSVGRPAFHCDVRIVDADDNDVAVGEVGEILARGPNIMKGYWNKPELTAQALRGGWYHTGDAGYRDRDGFIFLVDRVKDMIITGGENVYSTEVENVLYRHPAVKECAIIGIPSETWGEAVHAVVVLKDGMTADEAELIKFCRDRIAHYKCPRGVDFRDRPMPLSGVNKILKSALRKPYWTGHRTGIV
ncbi:MAG: long-chain-fatty-acid--CoA ligase [Hyphomicrobiales bacterium]|nr:long-chain-fatty-acid--CoA ligase [Hyphomicrobiales bacterium]MCP5374114.1 long-chain-fatty-acid--CoA ligase [Hyphomicrobiales bacterium]